MFSVVSFKKLKKKTIIQKLFSSILPKAVLESHQDSFGKIDVYTVFYYSNKEKALSLLLKHCEQKPYLSTAEVPKEYKRALACKQLTEKADNKRSSSLCLYFVPEKPFLTELCRNFSKVVIVGQEMPDFLDEIWKECGTVPCFCRFPVKTDYTLTGTEEPTLTCLPPPFDEICPSDFSPTLFAGLLYKENGIFIS